MSGKNVSMEVFITNNKIREGESDTQSMFDCVNLTPHLTLLKFSVLISFMLSAP